ncbi:MAG: stage II sporulation protein M [Candidatus Altiarchaeota archaeon]
MVLEAMIRAEDAENFPERMLLVGFFYASLGLLLAELFFGSYSSLSAIFITTIPLIIIIYDVMKIEETKDLKLWKETSRLREHERAIFLFIFLFLGMTIAYGFWFTLLPKEIGENLFSFQIEILKSITKKPVGYATHNINEVYSIISNNLIVLFACILFSFLYGAGAIFILTLNASVVGIAIGDLVRNSIAMYAGKSDIEFLSQYFSSFSMSFCFVIAHGILEMVGYFSGALAGGIISFAVINHDFRSKDFLRIVIDSVDLILLSILLIIIAGFVEVYITPLIC